MAREACFIGRRRALGELVHWLEHQPADGSIRVVTGGSGSGKSALLARLVAWRAPNMGCVLAAVRATGLDLAQVTRRIAAALSSTAEEPNTLIRAVHDRCLIVVDALDEAVTSAEAWAVATRLLVPLAQVEGVKVLVGARPGPDRSFVRALGRRPTIIDLDQPPYFDPGDLIEYAAASLRLDADPSAPSPYRNDAAATVRVAKAIAETAEPSFLVAGLTARARAHDPQVVSARQQRQAFPADADMAIADYLDALDDPKRAFDLLVPVAYARRPGLPRDTLWAALAQAYSGDPYGSADIDWLLASTAAYLLEEDGQAGASLVRLFHQALVDHIRSRTQLSMVDRTITRVLRQRAEAAGGWLHAERYARVHTASHAAQAGGGLLDGLVTDPAFLLAADRRTLLRALPAISQPQARRAGRCYRAMASRLDGDPAAGAAYLELAGRSAGNTTLADRIRQLGQPQPFTTQLARGREAAADLLVLHGHTGQVYAVAWGNLGTCAETPGSGVAESPTNAHQHASPLHTQRCGAPVLASASADATIRLWDPFAGTQLRVLHGHTDEVYALAWGTTGGAPVLASAGADATVRLWDPVDGTQLCVLHGHTHEVYALAWGNLGTCVETPGGGVAGSPTNADQDASPLHTRGCGAPVLASAGADATVRLWDPVDGTQLCVMHGHTHEVYALAWGTLDGVPVLASGGGDDTIRLWDPLEGAELRVLEGHTRRVWSVAWGVVGATPVLASASGDGTVRLWNPADGTGMRVLQGHTGQMYAVVWGVLGGTPMLASAGDYRTVRVWNPLDGTQLRILQGHRGWVWTVDWSTIEGTPLLATGGDDCTVRVWNPGLSPQGSTHMRALHGHTDEVFAVAWGTVHDAPLLASAGADAAIRLWDPANGTQRCVLHGHADEIYALAWGALDGAPVLASAGADDTVRLWDPLEGAELGILHGHVRKVWSVAWGALDGAPVLASAGADDTIRLWDPYAGTQRCVLQGHTDEIYALAWGALDGAPVLASAGADATIRLWDPVNGTQLRILQCRHTDGVWGLAWATLGGAPVLASAGADGTIRLCDPSEGTELRVLRGHTGQVNSIAFGALDGAPLLASAGRDGTVRLWDSSHEHQAVLCFDGPVHSAAIGPHDQLAIAGWNGVTALLIRSTVFTNPQTAR